MSEEIKIVPTLGMLVYYKLTESDVEQITKRRDDANRNREKMKEDSIGYQAHVGNPVEEGQIVTMLVVAVWGDNCINGKVMLDGNDSLWVTSAMLGDENGNWDWMPYQKGQAKKTEEVEEKLEESKN